MSVRHSVSMAMVGGDYCEVGIGGVLARGNAAMRFEIEEKEVRDCEGFFDYGTPCLHKCTWCLRIPGRSMGVEVSHDDVVITEVKKEMKVWCEIGWTAGYTGDVNVVNVEEDIVDDGCDGEVLIG